MLHTVPKGLIGKTRFFKGTLRQAHLYLRYWRRQDNAFGTIRLKYVVNLFVSLGFRGVKCFFTAESAECAEKMIKKLCVIRVLGGAISKQPY
jgi:hypothetical protein